MVIPQVVEDSWTHPSWQAEALDEASALSTCDHAVLVLIDVPKMIVGVSAIQARLLQDEIADLPEFRLPPFSFCTLPYCFARP